MKKFLVIVSVFICAFFALGISAFADCGPKASLTINVKGMEDGREYYLTLLSDYGRRYSDEDISKQKPEWRALYEISLNDEYFLYEPPVDTTYYKLNRSDSRTWGYMPPDKFKIVIYYPDDGSCIISEKLEKYAFDAYFTATVSGGEMSVVANGGAAGISAEIGGLLLRIVITVLLELGVARLFGYDGSKETKLILIMNICTQIFLNVMIAVGDGMIGGLGAIVAYILAEIVIFIIEACVYAVLLPRFTERRTREGRALGYAFAANAASFLVGGFILIIGEGLIHILFYT